MRHKWGSPLWPLSYPDCKCTWQEKLRYKYPRCKDAPLHHWDEGYEMEHQCARCAKAYRRMISDNHEKWMAGKLFYSHEEPKA